MDKRTFLKLTGAAGAGLVLSPWLGCAPGEATDPEDGGTTLAQNVQASDLGFAKDALAPGSTQKPWTFTTASTTRVTCGN